MHAPDRAPDAITPLVGYRLWSVATEADGPVFYPVNQRSDDWVGATHGWVSASCSVDSLARLLHPFTLRRGVFGWEARRHTAPEECCTCGFYAMKELDLELVLAADLYGRIGATTADEELFVLGRVELAGKVIEHERGYRAERARIIELIPIRGAEKRVGALARRFGVRLAAPVRPPRIWSIWARIRLLAARWARAGGVLGRFRS